MSDAVSVADAPRQTKMEATEMAKNMSAALYVCVVLVLLLGVASSSVVVLVSLTASVSTERMEMNNPPSACGYDVM